MIDKKEMKEAWDIKDKYFKRRIGQNTIRIAELKQTIIELEHENITFQSLNEHAKKEHEKLKKDES